MEQNEIQNLIKLYESYGFSLAKKYQDESILVFTIKDGYFQNADIIPLTITANTQQALSEFQELGFACQVRDIAHRNQAQEQLFKGFFSVDAVIERLESKYDKFTKGIVEVYSEKEDYEYINAPYIVNGSIGTLSPPQEVLVRLDQKRPILFLIEAAAGFGKTCTAYELVNLLIQKANYLPLFSELSRNREAVIFRHVLLDEIDRSFPVVSSRLVQSEMKSGKIITILDGFDELLRKTEEGDDFETSEPMLETIGEFLTGRAKIILTTRRTILFEGDAFHNWVDTHSEDFELIKIRISEPKIEHWLQEDRLESLEDSDLDLENIANPVILSYLRYSNSKSFEDITKNINQLIEMYFRFMLEREMTRQDLRIPPDDQESILKIITQDMIDFGYTSEQREYIVELILKSCSEVIESASKRYPPAERPTKEAIANKLASHALLDKSTEQNKIGFVNEFVLGNFVGKIIIDSGDWLNDEMRFIEPAVISYQPRSSQSKDELWHGLSNTIDYLDLSDQVDICTRLLKEIPFKLEDNEIQGLELKRIKVGQNQISNIQFNECTFTACTFLTENISNTTFLNCRYFECSTSGLPSKGEIFVLGAAGDSHTIDELARASIDEEDASAPDIKTQAEEFVLEKFWPVGRENITHKHRPIKGICANSLEISVSELYKAINRLKQKDILKEPRNSAFLEINLENINQIKIILGRE